VLATVATSDVPDDAVDNGGDGGGPCHTQSTEVVEKVWFPLASALMVPFWPMYTVLPLPRSRFASEETT
jgi:hypothetical protein